MELIANVRNILGKQVKKLRAQGEIPAVVYGKDVGSIPITISRNDFRQVYQEVGENGLLQVKLGDQSYSVLLQKLQINPLTKQLLHVDLLKVDLAKKVTIQVPLVVVGESSVVSSGEGILLTLHDELEVECLPADIPSEIQVDVSGLDSIDAGISTSQLSVDRNKVSIHLEDDDLVVKIAPAVMAEEEEEKEEGEQSEAVVEEQSEEESSEKKEEEEDSDL